MQIHPNQWQEIVSVTLDELHRAAEAHSCIMASYVLLDVLHAKGIADAYPLTVKPRIFNPRFTDRLGPDPSNMPYDQLDQLADDGCYMIAIGAGEPSFRHWPAHLVVIVPQGLKGKDAMCDLTIMQANKEEWGIHLMPVLSGVPEGFLDGSGGLSLTINGCRIVYKAFPEDDSFMKTPIWTQGTKRGPIVQAVLRRLPRQLG